MKSCTGGTEKETLLKAFNNASLKQKHLAQEEVFFFILSTVSEKTKDFQVLVAGNYLY